MFWKVPGTFGEVLDVFEKFPGCSEVPSVFWKVPGTLGEVPNVFVMFSPLEVEIEFTRHDTSRFRYIYLMLFEV